MVLLMGMELGVIHMVKNMRGIGLMVRGTVSGFQHMLMAMFTKVLLRMTKEKGMMEYTGFVMGMSTRDLGKTINIMGKEHYLA